MSDSFAERQLAAIGADRLARFAPRPVATRHSAFELCAQALRSPIASAPLAELARGCRRIVVLISDASRDEPRAEMLDALSEHIALERVRLVVASGTHAADASVVPQRFAGVPVAVHDGRTLESTVDLGVTARGTRVRVSRDVADSDLVVVTGRIRPHYFAGFSGGTKGVFPGVAYAEDALDNHRLKSDPSARLGRIEDNVCRLDMEEAALRVPARLFVLNVLADIDGNAVAAAAGHPIAAHRALLPRARALFGVVAPRSPVVVVADRPPVSRSLYQASKLVPPAGVLLEPGGTVILVAECDLSLGPTARVNEGIYRLGVARQLPAGHRIVLVSTQDPEAVRTTYAEPAASLSVALDEALARRGIGRGVLLWRAGECIAHALDSSG